VSLPRLYAVLDTGVAAGRGWTVADLGQAFLDGGAQLIQLRAKHLDARALLEAADRLVRLAESSGARIIVNDRADVAAMCGAAGVHLGQEDLRPRDARALARRPGDDRALDAHARAGGRRARRADRLQSPSALSTAPQRRTPATRPSASSWFAMPRRPPTRGPVVAIGGITLATAPDVIAAGATAVAVITDLVATGDPAGRVREYLGRLGR
jgi:thiamine-phosphate pyrophosphorylase